MKNALILHGTNADSSANWFKWLAGELEKNDYKTWVPDLPNAKKPNMKDYLEFLHESDFEFNRDTIIIGHSSGAVAATQLTSEVSAKIQKLVLVGTFTDSLGRKELEGLFEEKINYKGARQRSRKVIVMHSDDDPNVPLQQAKQAAQKLQARLIIKNGEGHFNTDHDKKYTEFPELLEVILAAPKKQHQGTTLTNLAE